MIGPGFAKRGEARGRGPRKEASLAQLKARGAKREPYRPTLGAIWKVIGATVKDAETEGKNCECDNDKALRRLGRMFRLAGYRSDHTTKGRPFKNKKK